MPGHLFDPFGPLRIRIPVTGFDHFMQFLGEKTLAVEASDKFQMVLAALFSPMRLAAMVFFDLPPARIRRVLGSSFSSSEKYQAQKFDKRTASYVLLIVMTAVSYGLDG